MILVHKDAILILSVQVPLTSLPMELFRLLWAESMSMGPSDCPLTW